MSQYSSISISQTNFLNYGRSKYALPNFRLTTDPITSMWPSQPQAINFFHMLLLCHIFFVAFILTMLNFHFIFLKLHFCMCCSILLTNPLFFMKTYLSFKFRPLAHNSCKFSQFSGHLSQLPVILPILSFSCRADIVTTWVTEGTMLSNQVSPIT